MVVAGFLICITENLLSRIIKGETTRNKVPATMFNISGTPDTFITTFGDYPMAQAGEAKKVPQQHRPR